jgi:hypothetical protein
MYRCVFQVRCISKLGKVLETDAKITADPGVPPVIER